MGSKFTTEYPNSEETKKEKMLEELPQSDFTLVESVKAKMAVDPLLKSVLSSTTAIRKHCKSLDTVDYVDIFGNVWLIIPIGKRNIVLRLLKVGHRKYEVNFCFNTDKNISFKTEYRRNHERQLYGESKAFDLLSRLFEDLLGRAVTKDDEEELSRLNTELFAQQITVDPKLIRDFQNALEQIKPTKQEQIKDILANLFLKHNLNSLYSKFHLVNWQKVLSENPL